VTQTSRLDDPEYAKFAWRRYWWLMRWMATVTVTLTALVLGAFYLKYGMISVHLYIATAGAIIAAIMLTAGLMGLVFLSSGSGHDGVIEDPFNEEADK
jgi:hypothetical protein